MSKYDYICVGAGLFSSVFAHFLKQFGKKILVVEKREHVGGNCYTRNVDGINVHEYGPHITHCSDKRIWNFYTSFAQFNHFVNRPKVLRDGKIYSFPINLFTLYQLWGVKTPEEARKKLEEVRIPIAKPANLEEWCLSQVGEEIYELFIRHYTKRQWKTDPKNLPSFIIRRLPIRLNFDDNYFTDCFQGCPVNGYTQIFEKMLEGTEIQLGVDFSRDKARLTSLLKAGGQLVYSGRCDELFDFDKGELPYRNLRFEHQRLEISDHQGVAVLNRTGPEVEYTRTTEHKHFEFGTQAHTIVTYEYPTDYDRNNIPYYPINVEENDSLAREYIKRAEAEGIIIGGRLGKYVYRDQHQIIGEAMHVVEKHVGCKIDEKGKIQWK